MPFKTSGQLRIVSSSMGSGISDVREVTSAENAVSQRDC
jgi:hypothetical protein